MDGNMSRPMGQVTSSDMRLGIIAGGQLGKMLILEAAEWGVDCSVLDSDPQGPAAGIASHFVKGDLRSFEDVLAFGRTVDVLTLEIEHVNADAIEQLAQEGVTVRPSPAVLRLVQDKGLQKCFYRDHGVPTAPFRLFESATSLRKAVHRGECPLPFVQKLCRGGYDGRGVAVIRHQDDLCRLLDGASLVEDLVDLEAEIAVIAARNPAGEVRCFPPVGMVFNAEANLVERLVAPAELPAEKADAAVGIASELASAIGMEGVLAVEFFLDRSGNLLVNEIAPRPHNSGHHTIEANVTSQYEQHLRGVLDLPLGSVDMLAPAVMINLLGEAGECGRVRYEGFAESLALDGVSIHLYGKKETRPFRKMGHVTILGKTIADACRTADIVRERLKVRA